MNRSIITRTLVAALAVAGAVPLTATVASANGNGNDSNQPVNDTWITTKVKAELATTDGVKSTNIDVKTVNGVVTLTGVLPTELAVKKAVAAAESIQGVSKLGPEIEVIAARASQAGTTIKRSTTMNEDKIKGQWKQLAGKLKAKWGKLTDDDLKVADGNSEYLAGKIQERYGIARDEAERQIRDFDRSL